MSGHLFSIILCVVLFNIILCVVFVEVLLKGGGVRTTQGATVFVCRRVVGGGGGSEQQTGPQFLFVEKRRNKEKGLQIGCSKGGGGQNNTRGHSLCL